MIAANFTKSQKSITVESVTQGDYGQKLSIHGLSLPSSVEVHFVAAGEQEGIKMFGTTQAEETVVEIPNLLIAKGKDLTAYIFVCDSMEGKTVRTIRIPVHRKPEVEEIELPPDEQDIVRELMGLVNGFESEIDKLDEKKADKAMVGTPLVADSIRDMRDMEKIYVYVGNETGELIPGNWYYWDGNYWVSGGVYNAVALGERSVTTGKLANYSVSERCIADGAVTEAKLGNQAVSERCIADKGITYEKFSDEIAMVEFEGGNVIAEGTEVIFMDGNNYNFTVIMDLPDNAIFVRFKLNGIYNARIQTIPVILTYLNDEDIKYSKNAEFLINGMETNSIGQECDTSCNKLKISGTVNGFLFSPTDSYLTYTFYDIKEIISAKFPSLKLMPNNIPDGMISPQKIDNTKPHEHFLMKSSNGTVYKIRVTDAGELSVEADR